MTFNFTLAPGWTLTHIINLEPDWQVNLKNDEHVVVATGATIDEALAAADHKIANHDYVGILINVFAMRSPKTKSEQIDGVRGKELLQALGLAKKAEPVKRRL